MFTIIDDDADGLLNDWELRGYSANNDGVVDVDLPALGAKSKRKDLFIEIDWMEGCAGNSPSKKPLPEALDQIIHSFEIAPVRNPNKSTGITLHVDYGQGSEFTGGNAIDCQNPLVWPDDFQTIKNANCDTRRQRIFHYNIWGDTYNGTTSSGIAELPGDDFLVSLGAFTGGNGTQNQQAGTFMHEFGHNLGLRHGGTKDNVNYKPNHLSVMSYSFQLTEVLLNGRLGNFDYTRVSPPDLDELALDETKGLNGDDAVNSYGTIWFCQNLNNQQRMTVSANDPIDWNCDDTIEQFNVATDINKDNSRNILKEPNIQWSSLVLADTNRPGIPSGNDVGPFEGTQTQNGSEQFEPPAAELMQIENQTRRLMQQK